MNVFDLIIGDKEQVLLSSIFLDDENVQKCNLLINEHLYVKELQDYGLPVTNKILLEGCSGCGKTLTAKAIAHTLGKKIYILNLGNIVNSRIGETSQNLRQVFEKAGKENAVLFLDEFDHIAKSRASNGKDVGEMHRLVNTLIQLIDYFPEHALMLAATNHPEMIDNALLRRFQLKMSFELPAPDILNRYYDSILARFPEHVQDIERKYNISFAEAKDYAYTTIKVKLITQFQSK